MVLRVLENGEYAVILGLFMIIWSTSLFLRLFLLVGCIVVYLTCGLNSAWAHNKNDGGVLLKQSMEGFFGWCVIFISFKYRLYINRLGGVSLFE